MTSIAKTTVLPTHVFHSLSATTNTSGNVIEHVYERNISTATS